MSRFDELDHKIGRHESVPNLNCPICNPKAPREPSAVKIAAEKIQPMFARWGDVWRSPDGPKVFVNPYLHGGKNDKGGYWVDASAPIPDPPKNLPKGLTYFSILPPNVATQMEFGTGEWAPETKGLVVTNALPSAAALRDPLGVDLPKWAAEQNLARLIMKIRDQNWFPVSEVFFSQREDHLTLRTNIEAGVQAIPRPVLF
jgi:hypothetical protein